MMIFKQDDYFNIPAAHPRDATKQDTARSLRTRYDAVVLTSKLLPLFVSACLVSIFYERPYLEHYFPNVFMLLAHHFDDVPHIVVFGVVIQ